MPQRITDDIRADIIDMLINRPDLNQTQIAQEAGVSATVVNQLNSRYNLRNPNESVTDLSKLNRRQKALWFLSQDQVMMSEISIATGYTLPQLVELDAKRRGRKFKQVKNPTLP